MRITGGPKKRLRGKETGTQLNSRKGGGKIGLGGKGDLEYLPKSCRL